MLLAVLTRGAAREIGGRPAAHLSGPFLVEALRDADPLATQRVGPAPPGAPSVWAFVWAVRLTQNGDFWLGQTRWPSTSTPACSPSRCRARWRG
jgi:hypothetical protein